jgi:hypothetical protein
VNIEPEDDGFIPSVGLRFYGTTAVFADSSREHTCQFRNMPARTVTYGDKNALATHIVIAGGSMQIDVHEC